MLLAGRPIREVWLMGCRRFLVRAGDVLCRRHSRYSMDNKCYPGGDLLGLRDPRILIHCIFLPRPLSLLQSSNNLNNLNLNNLNNRNNHINLNINHNNSSMPTPPPRIPPRRQWIE